MMPLRRFALPLLLAPLLPTDPAIAQGPMQAVEIRPAARSVMDGQRQEFYLRFDRPVDHNRSRLEVVQDSRVVRTLQPRLQAQPNVLFATTGGLPAGSYTLRWFARGQSPEDSNEGSLDFSVGR